MGNKHHNRSLIPKHAADRPQTYKYFNQNPSIMDSWQAVNAQNATVILSIRFLQHDFECFSDWGKEAMHSFWNFSKRLHETTWQQVLHSGGGGKTYKTGLGSTIIPISDYPKSHFKDELDPELKIIELRVDQRRRVHGYRDKFIFYLFWLDKDHKIFPS